MCRWDKPEGGSRTADTAGAAGTAAGTARTAGTVGTGSSLSMKGISLSLMSLTALSIYEYNQLAMISQIKFKKILTKFLVIKVVMFRRGQQML
jgi:hypothetical protein